MQYQVIERKTGEVVAWIDTNQTSQVVHKDYDLVVGENLTAVETEDTPLKLRVKFFDKELYPDGLQKIGGKKSDWIDLRAREDIVLEKGAFKLIPLGVAIQLPEGYEAQIRPRSGLAAKYGITVTNAPGTVE